MRLVIESDLLQINPYSEYEFQLRDNSWWINKLPEDVIILWNRYNTPYWGSTIDHTPRSVLYNRFVAATTFYYLDGILKSTDSPIIDIGCGSNFFKTFNKNIIGLDKNIAADINDYFSDEFVATSQNKYAYAIAINSIHFQTSCSQIWDRVKTFMSVIAPGGVGFVTFNIGVLHLFTPQEENVGTTRHAAWTIDSNLRVFIKEHPEFDFQIVDQAYFDPDDGPPITSHRLTNQIDGNIRLLIRKR